MIKFAAILTSAAIACSGAAAPAREDIACRIAALHPPRLRSEGLRTQRLHAERLRAGQLRAVRL